MENIKNFKIKWERPSKNFENENIDFKNYPKIPRKKLNYPAIYSWQVSGDKNNIKAIYIGEASNLGRRFYNYKNPGPHLKVPKRIKKELTSKEYKNKKINFYQLKFDGLIFNKTLKIKKNELKYKSNRLIIESLVILYYRNKKVRILNK